MRRERSAGVILFRTDVQTRARLYLLLDYGRHWDYPKGHVQAGEDDTAAAVRELREETGIAEAELLPGFKREIVYFFRGGGNALIRKEVIFFIAKTSSEQVSLSHEHSGWAWLGYEDAMRRLTYSNARQVLRAANEFLEVNPAQRGNVTRARRGQG